MEWLLYVVAVLFVLIGLGCLALVMLSLPGTWIMLGVAGLIEYLDRFYLPEGDRQTFGWWVLGVCVALAVLGEVIEFAASALGAKKSGSSRRGLIGALIGGVVGVFLFTPLLFFIPLIGSLVGAALGAFAGAFLGELSAERATLKGSVRPATGAAIGRMAGTTGKLAVTVVVWVVLSISAFWV